MDVVQEMVKVHTLVPAKVKDCEVKLTPLKQHIGFNTPVRLVRGFVLFLPLLLLVFCLMHLKFERCDLYKVLRCSGFLKQSLI